MITTSIVPAKQVKKADEAVRLLKRLGWASGSDVLKLIKNKFFVPPPEIATDDLARAVDIYIWPKCSYDKREDKATNQSRYLGN